MTRIKHPRAGIAIYSVINLCLSFTALADCHNELRKRIHETESCYAQNACSKSDVRKAPGTKPAPKACQAAVSCKSTVRTAQTKHCQPVLFLQPTGPISPARAKTHHTSRLVPQACQTNRAPYGWFHPGDALYIKRNFPDFYDIVTMNSPKSHANNDLCIKGMLCFSGLANVDYRFYNRNEQLSSSGSNYGIGVRPLFREVDGLKNRDATGSLNNLNIFMDTAINQWVSAHVDLAYVNASIKARGYTYTNIDWDSVYDSAAALKVNQAYFMLANPALTPLYVQIGRFAVNFGDYEPFPMTESFTQLLSEMRAGGIIVGGVFENGIYASVNYSMAHLSYGPKNIINRVGLANWDNNKDKNYGALLGFRRSFDDDQNCRHMSVNTNISYIDNIRDSMYLTQAFNFFNGKDFSESAPFNAVLAKNVAFLMQRAAGLSLHAQVEYNQFGLTADYVTALQRLNPKSSESKIRAWGLNGYVHFRVLCHHSKLELGYQLAHNAKVFFSEHVPFMGEVNAFAPDLFNPGHLLPDYRYSGAYSVDLMHHITGSLQAVVDRDLPEKRNGTGLSSYMLLFRLGFEF